MLGARRRFVSIEHHAHRDDDACHEEEKEDARAKGEGHDETLPESRAEGDGVALALGTTSGGAMGWAGNEGPELHRARGIGLRLASLHLGRARGGQGHRRLARGHLSDDGWSNRSAVLVESRPRDLPNISCAWQYRRSGDLLVAFWITWLSGEVKTAEGSGVGLTET